MRNAYGLWKCFIALSIALCLLCGCGINQQVDSAQANFRETNPIIETSVQEREEFSADYTELLQAVTAEFIDITDQEDRHLVTIDISAFDRSAEEYEEWVQETYAVDDTLIIVFTEVGEAFETIDAAQEYMQQNGHEEYENLSSGCDWTAIKIKRVAEEETKENSEVLSVDISYPILAGGKRLEVQMQYIDEAWEVARFKMMYVM